jgi:hypothetical protein
MASFHLKGGWKETRGLQRPILAETPVSESWMPLASWFEPASVAVPTEGGGHLAPPGGWPEVQGPWPFGPKGPEVG